MQIEAAKRLAVKDRRLAQTKMEAALKSVRRGLDEVRRSVHLLHEGDTVPDNERLVGLLKAIMETTGVTITYCLAPDIKLNPIQRHVIYRALQEGITNGIRHGIASLLILRSALTRLTINSRYGLSSVIMVADPARLSLDSVKLYAPSGSRAGWIITGRY